MILTVSTSAVLPSCCECLLLHCRYRSIQSLHKKTVVQVVQALKKCKLKKASSHTLNWCQVCHSSRFVKLPGNRDVKAKDTHRDLRSHKPFFIIQCKSQILQKSPDKLSQPCGKQFAMLVNKEAAHYNQ